MLKDHDMTKQRNEYWPCKNLDQPGFAQWITKDPSFLYVAAMTLIRLSV